MIQFEGVPLIISEATGTNAINPLSLRNIMRSIQSLLPILFACSTIGFAKDSTSSLLMKYEAAACLPSSNAPGEARHWNTTVSLLSGTKVTIRGGGFAGANWVTATYPASGQEYIAAKPYDYVYPLEIRVDEQDDMLYVAANGLAGGIWEQTWLFAFDLREHKQVARHRIHYKDLPARCPAGEKK